MPSERRTRDDIEYTEYKGEDAHRTVYLEVLKRMYFMFRLFHGTFERNLVGDKEAEKVMALTTVIQTFFEKVSDDDSQFERMNFVVECILAVTFPSIFWLSKSAMRTFWTFSEAFNTFQLANFHFCVCTISSI